MLTLYSVVWRTTAAAVVITALRHAFFWRPHQKERDRSLLLAAACRVLLVGGLNAVASAFDKPAGLLLLAAAVAWAYATRNRIRAALQRYPYVAETTGAFFWFDFCIDSIIAAYAAESVSVSLFYYALAVVHAVYAAYQDPVQVLPVPVAPLPPLALLQEEEQQQPELERGGG